jgi:bacteriocin-like protein
MTNPQFDSLTDNDLEQVTGGMSCSTAINLANGYAAIASVCLAVGLTSDGAMYAGMGRGVLRGGCS